MDERLFFIIVLIGLVIIISAGITIHETLESEYDQCLDACNSIYHDGTLETKCIMSCNLMQNDNCKLSEVKNG